MTDKKETLAAILRSQAATMMTLADIIDQPGDNVDPALTESLAPEDPPPLEESLEKAAAPKKAAPKKKSAPRKKAVTKKAAAKKVEPAPEEKEVKGEVVSKGADGVEKKYTKNDLKKVAAILAGMPGGRGKFDEIMEEVITDDVPVFSSIKPKHANIMMEKLQATIQSLNKAAESADDFGEEEDDDADW